MTPTAKIRAPASWESLDVQVPREGTVEVHWARTLRDRLLSWPWRPLHHVLVWHLEDVTDVAWDMGDDGLYLIYHSLPARRPAERYRVDPDRLIPELTLLTAAFFVGYVLAGLPW